MSHYTLGLRFSVLELCPSNQMWSCSSSQSGMTSSSATNSVHRPACVAVLSTEEKSPIESFGSSRGFECILCNQLACFLTTGVGCTYNGQPPPDALSRTGRTTKLRNIAQYQRHKLKGTTNGFMEM